METDVLSGHTFCPISPFALSALGVSGLALVEGIFVVRGEVEPIFVLMPLSGGAQSATGFCRHVYPDGSFAPYFQQINSGTFFQSNTPRQRGLYLISDRAPRWRFIGLLTLSFNLLRAY